MLVGGGLPERLSDHACQAAGLVAAQRNCSVSTALATLRAQAQAMGQNLDKLAREVLESRVRFDD